MSSIIAAIARQYLGQQEKPGNAGFKSADFEKKMKAVGFHTGDAWCALLGELIWKEAYSINKEVLAILDKLFSASAVATYSNFANSKKFTVSKIPVVGALAVWRHGDGWQGHLGVVVDVQLEKNTFFTVEGNTNNDGSREGYLVAEKPRKLNLPYNANGLNLIGFVYPI